MSRFFYQKLALSNLRKNSQTYQAYLLTCIGSIAMYFVMHTIAANQALNAMAGGTNLKSLLGFGLVVMAVFSAIFLLYANSFLIKRRKKEFGLFNILGMGKRHLAKVMLWETIFTAALGLVLGIVSGMILSKLMFLALLKLITIKVPLTFQISIRSVGASVALFGAIFLISFLYNLGQIQRTKPIELLKAEHLAEREPKTRWLLILLGLASLGSGYYMALTIQSPLQALNMFFIAVLLVMVGTYSLFTAGTVGALKLLRRNKNFYYQAKHFTTISGMLFRMKQNAIGLANICILSAAVLVTLSTTLSLYIGVEDQLSSRYAREIEISLNNVDDKTTIEIVRSKISTILEQHNQPAQNAVEYSSFAMVTTQERDSFRADPNYLKDFSPDYTFLVFLPLADYENIADQKLSLLKNEVFVFSKRSYPYDSFSVLGRTFTVINKTGVVPPGQSNLLLDSYISNYFLVVVADMEVLAALSRASADVNQESRSTLNHYLGFDLTSSRPEQIQIYKEIRASLGDIRSDVGSRAAARDDFYILGGGFFFVGLFLGSLFLIGTALIIYYKQVTEGYADQRRFAIMQRIGMGQEEVKKTIRNQILMVFFLPLTVAGIHILFAFKMISKLLGVFNLTNVALFAWCSLGVFLIFSLCYGIVYTLTARIYYEIVRI